MTHAEFTTQMDLLVETYTDRAYPAPRVKRIWNWARKVNGKTFAEAVDNAIADCMQPPLLSKLKEYYAEARAKHPDREKINCDYCDGSGFILGPGVMPLAFACRCEAGLQIPEYVTRWSGEWVRMVPHKSELGVAAVQRIIGATMKGFN